MHALSRTAGLQPHLQRLDNECSTALKAFLTNEQIDYQLVPPGLHRRNAAERAIRTFKNNFIAGLCSVDKNFPLHLWVKLLPQAETTLNLLRGSRINPKLSAHAQMHGWSVQLQPHSHGSDRTTWSPHGKDGWYTGPALESYRCFTVWIWASRATRICDTLTWLPTKIAMPVASSADRILAGIAAILHALRHPSPASPLAPLSPSHHDALLRLADLLTTVVSPPTDASAPTSGLPVVPTRSIITTPTSLVAHPNAVQPPGADPALRVGLPVTPPTSLRVPSNLPPPVPTAPIPRTVHFAPLPAEVGVATFPNSTGLRGKRRRKADRTRLLPRRPLSAANTVHPNKQRPCPRPPSVPSRVAPPAVVARHHHGTRLAARLRHISAVAHTTILAAARTAHSAPAHFALHGNAFNPDTGQLAEYRELSQCSEGPLWQHSNADEIGRLAQGHGEQKGTNTMFFIKVTDIPKGRKATYLRVVAALRPEKANPRRVRWTVGGDRIDYPDDVSTKTADAPHHC